MYSWSSAWNSLSRYLLRVTVSVFLWLNNRQKRHRDKIIKIVSEIKIWIISAAPSDFRSTEPGPWFENHNRQTGVRVPSH